MPLIVKELSSWKQSREKKLEVEGFGDSILTSFVAGEFSYFCLFLVFRLWKGIILFLNYAIDCTGLSLLIHEPVVCDSSIHSSLALTYLFCSENFCKNYLPQSLKVMLTSDVWTEFSQEGHITAVLNFHFLILNNNTKPAMNPRDPKTLSVCIATPLWNYNYNSKLFFDSLGLWELAHGL